MSKSIFSQLVSLCFALMPAYLFAQDSSSGKANEVYYFIDADCTQCSVLNHPDSKIWIATTGIYRGDFNNKDKSIEKFRNKIIEQYKADSTLLQRVVFRFQNSEYEIKKNYLAKENKMKVGEYTLIKIEL